MTPEEYLDGLPEEFDALDDVPYDPLSAEEQRRAEIAERLAAVYLQDAGELLDSAKLEPDWLVPNAIPKGSICFVAGKPGCLAGDVTVHLNRGGNGRSYTVRELYYKQNGISREGWNGRPWDLTAQDTMIARAEGGVVRLCKLKQVWFSGVKKVFELKTETGRTIKATDEHPFLTFDRGFVPLGQLRVGDQVAVNVGLPKGTNKRAQGLRVNYVDVDTLHHPRQRAKANSALYRMPLHRVAYEAKMNGLTTEQMIWILQSDCVVAAELKYLTPDIVVHHIDGNPQNNAQDNLQALSFEEHARLHQAETAEWGCLQRIGHEAVTSITPLGEEETFDLEVEDDPHNFLANDFVVHNSAKSWLAYDLVLAVLQQRDWIGFGVPLVGPNECAVVLNFDNPHAECARRFLRLGLQREDRMFTHSFGAHTPPDPLPAVLQLPDAFEPLATLMYYKRPALIVVDSLRQAHTGDESSSQEMALVMGQLKRLAMHGAAVVVVHHSRKNDASMRGSTEIEATADAITDVEREAEVSLVTWRKTRGWEPDEPTITVQVVDEGDRTFVRGGISLKNLLANGGLRRSEIAERMRLSQAAAKKIVDRAIEVGTCVEMKNEQGVRIVELV